MADMNFRHTLPLLVLSGIAPALMAQDTTAPAQPAQAPASAAAAATPAQEQPVFGPYRALVFDHAILQDVKVDDAGNIFLKFQPDQLKAQVRIRISNEDGYAYRKWLDGEDELVSLDNAGRPANAWTDRVQTAANYIEYRDATHLFLKLAKIAQ